MLPEPHDHRLVGVDAPLSLRHNPLGKHIRDALLHLNDLDTLQTHPLTQYLHGETGATTAGHALHQHLREAIQQLQPHPDIPRTARAWQIYQLVMHRYVEGKSVAEVRQRLSISRSEYQREHRRALDALLSLVAADLLPTPAAGKAAPTPVLAAVPQDAAARGGMDDRSWTVPLVGRAEELDTLCSHYDAAVTEGSARVIILSGEPGVGKTRLAREFGRYARRRGAAFLEGSYQRGPRSSYRPWVMALRPALPLLDASRLEVVVRPYAAALSSLFPELCTHVAAPPLQPTPTDGDHGPGVSEGLVHLLTALATVRPLVVFLDDLQWAQDLALFEAVSRSLAAVPVVLVGAFRPWELCAQSSLACTWLDLIRARRTTTVRLEPLSHAEARSLAAHYLGEAAAARLSPAVYQLAEGNPFVLEELLWDLVARGEHDGSDGALALDTGGVPNPEAVRLFVAERLEHTDGEVQDFLMRAAVLGPRFSLGLLQAYTEETEDALIALVDRAVQARLLADASIPEEEAFIFTSAVVREVLYRRLSLPRRRRLHRRAAEALQYVYRDRLYDYAAQLGDHLSHSLAAGDRADAARYRKMASAPQAFLAN